jgi:hypothetical protein
MKYGGKGKINTPYKKHLWDCIINDDYLYEINWLTATNSIKKIEKFYINYIKIKFI